MNNAIFTICQANQTQRDYVLKHHRMKDEDKRKHAIIYVAINGSDDIIGWIIVNEQDVPAPIMGKCWCIYYLFVRSEFRRKGIATALVTQIKEHAELLNIVYYWGFANPSIEASMFWLNQGVTMHPQGDTSKPQRYENYTHIFSYLIRRKSLRGGSCCNRIRKITKDEILDLIKKYTEGENKKAYLLSKADELFGFVSVADNNETNGVIFALPDSMYPPLNSTRWLTFVFVDPKFRHQGIGRSLVMRLYQYAQGKEAIQLTCSAMGDDIGFWYGLGFDISFRGANSKGVMLATAMIRVK